MEPIAPSEILALARLVDQIDYYRLLQLQRDATTREIQRAFHTCSRTFHPDANRHQSSQIQAGIRPIAKRITEAYTVLRDPRRRALYDEQLDSGGGVRLTLSRDASDVTAPNPRGTSAQGRQYHALALQNLQQKDFSSAIRNLKTALTFEPGNETFEKLLKTSLEQMDSHPTS
ncbi:J domain-containing protein [Myxococcota bacterium]|nr:J domain-containing protein [Myxococcota bacterium]